LSEFVVEMLGISKRFPGVKALDQVNLQILPGEVHALMGENGAGKSTLMKILNGLYQPDEGDIFFSGTKIRVDNPAKAMKMGIAMIYQELNPINDMTVAENIYLGREPMKPNRLFIDYVRLYKDAAEVLSRYKLYVNPKWKISRLSTAQKQMVEIIKAVTWGAKIIVMDEPTSSLTKEEVNTLFSTIRTLKADGVPIIYISHRMEEVFEISDRVTVLRDGKMIATYNTPEIQMNKLVSLMVGRELADIFNKQPAKTGDIALEARDLAAKGKFSGVSFQVSKGEILGIYGLVGAGRSEVMQVIFGIDSMDAGEILLNGKLVTISSPEDAIRHGIAMVTEDRKEMGLVLCRDIKENVTLASLDTCSTGPFINNGKEIDKCNEILVKLHVRMSSLRQNAESLSGGNQQKVVLCKWLTTLPKVLILDEPTRGIDVGAKAEIHDLMNGFAQQGMAVIMVSSELPEIIGMSDRVLVMGNGKICGEFLRGQFTQDNLLTTALEV
jgi:ABC-type sugar transport system ATPase subunit